MSDVLAMAGLRLKSTAKGATRLEMSVSCFMIAYLHAVRSSYVKQGERGAREECSPRLHGAVLKVKGARVEVAGLRMRDSADEMRHSPRNI